MEATEKIISIMTRWLRCESLWRNPTQGQGPQDARGGLDWGTSKICLCDHQGPPMTQWSEFSHNPLSAMRFEFNGHCEK